MKLLEEFQQYNDIVILKARQLGISWLCCGYALWKCLFNEGAKVLLMSQGEDEAIEMVSKCRFIFDHLSPLWMVKQKHPDSRERMDFASHDSILMAVPSTENAGRGTDATLVIRDELAQHPFGKRNFVAVGPTIDAGGQIIDMSTINKIDTGNHFTERVTRALNHESNAHMIFLGWRERPKRLKGMGLDDWYRQIIMTKYTEFEREEQYPEKLEDALSPPKSVNRFDREILEDMLKDCYNPIREEYEGYVKIYKEASPGKKYCLVADPSEGAYDPCGAWVIDSQSGEGVVEVRGKISLVEQSRILFGLWNEYFKPFTGVERNAAGIHLIEDLKNLGINTWFYCDGDKHEKEGWWTSSTTRPIMLTDLAEAIKLRQYRIPSGRAISEFLRFIRTAKKPDGESIGGGHGEDVMCWAIYSQIIKKMPVPAGVVKSYHMRGTI